jgi:hypothetical protein
MVYENNDRGLVAPVLISTAFDSYTSEPRKLETDLAMFVTPLTMFVAIPATTSQSPPPHDMVAPVPPPPPAGPLTLTSW